MCGRLDGYLLTFSKIRTESSQKNWKEIISKTSFEAVLLICLFDLIEEGTIVKNYIEPTQELVKTFQNYIVLLSLKNTDVSIAQPFLSLDDTPFWHLRPKATQQTLPGQIINSLKELRHNFWGAKFSDDLFPLLQMRSYREKLRMILIKTYFPPEKHRIFQTKVDVKKDIP